MIVRLKDKPDVTGFATKFNTYGVGSVIMGFDEGDMSDMAISELDVQLADGRWVSMSDAFKNRDLITDNYNTCFFEPRSPEERERGWTP